MKAKRYAGSMYPLALVLLFSALVPCGLVEAVAGSSLIESPWTITFVSETGPSAEEATGGSATAGDEVRLIHLDCCTGCLICCASYTPAPAMGPLTLIGVAPLRCFFAVQRLLEVPLTIWRPPRI